MNRLVKRYIILFFVIIIPLIAAYLVGSYGYNSEKFGQGVWEEEFRKEFLSFGGEEFTTKEKIDKHVKYGINSQYYIYDETPIYSNVIKNSNDEDLFSIDIYRAIYKYTVEGEQVDRIQYLYFIYNVQYLKVRDLFNADTSLKQEIDQANVPTLSINIYEVLDDNSIGETDIVTLTSSKMVPDYDSDVDYKTGAIASEGDEINEGDELVYVITGFNPATNIEWSSKTKVEVIATVEGIKDNTNQDINTIVSSFIVDDYEVLPEEVDQKDFVSSYKQNLRNAGYFGWAFKNYLWWIGLITFGAIGLITGSFYLVWRAEEEKIYQSKKYKKVKK